MLSNRFNALATLSIEREFALSLSLDDVIDGVARL